ncbi:Alpha-mannosidase [Neolecta irregularis DAH-3]|uniref:Alpha-mannosidase n=1 Tax=Neolecta irregularis (strain DAH-3) TaxID=1198029 RepID=A0A1U7LN07_NEOID|nr:Alpha-mannosidase [Neolecta irregularis DAH-3]|eukprot:OLL24027.1 Alpha-mannosidase [Neolecta irregularis DAH-3]
MSQSGLQDLKKNRLGSLLADDQFKDVNLRSMLDIARFDDEEFVKMQKYSVPELRRPLFEQVLEQATWENVIKGVALGPSWSTHWFKILVRIPKGFEKVERIQFEFNMEGEGMIFSEKGDVIHGLTGGNGLDCRKEFILPESWRDGYCHLFYIETAVNGMFGLSDGISPPDMGRVMHVNTADIVVPNMPAYRLFWDFQIISDCAIKLPQNSWESYLALEIGNKIQNAFMSGVQDTLEECRKLAQEFLGKDVDSDKVFDSKGDPIITAVGHCHIDTAWLWPYAETRRKIARSWSTQLDLMDRYPEYTFTASSAQQYKWLLEDYPELFARIQDANENGGKFKHIGGTWVEMDTNIPSGESLVRQFLYGQRFFENYFKKRCETFWLPDTFGYSIALPQICRLAGAKYFFTQKLSWNNINKFPHTTFNWVGLDGTQTPAESYNAQCDVDDIIKCVTQHKNLGEDKTSLLLFGNGDGGPNLPMLERLRRCRGVSNTIGALPLSKTGSADQFFEDIQKNTYQGRDLVQWVGELYLEFHRGTYTTQAKIKAGNRHSELLMRDIEYFCTLASLFNPTYKFPKKNMDVLWEKVLLYFVKLSYCADLRNQFHDCLPGSAIEMVNVDVREIYDEVQATGNNILNESLRALGFVDDGGEVVAINSLAWSRTEIIDIQSITSTSPGDSKRFPFVDIRIDSVEKAVVSSEPKMVSCPGNTAKFCESKPYCSVDVQRIKDNVFKIKNGVLEVTIENGIITSIYDQRVNREIVPDGAQVGKYMIYNDQPLFWDAWDTEIYHLETGHPLTSTKVSVIESGPLRSSILVETRISEKSWIKTKISLEAYNGQDGAWSMIKYDAEVEWQENRKFLKIEFPVDVHSGEANYECAFGVIKRPTHANTSWDAAKFEVVCHKWADISENGYGVAVLNDSKYGFATQGNLMRLSLLRSPKAPDAHADMGRHKFKFALLPHIGNYQQANISRAAYNFNVPLRVGQTKDIIAVNSALNSILLAGDPSIILETIKRGEDDEDMQTSLKNIPKRNGRSVILRLFETYGGHATAKIITTLPIKNVCKTNILEDDGEKIKFDKHDACLEIQIAMRAFEIATIRLIL